MACDSFTLAYQLVMDNISKVYILVFSRPLTPS